MTHIGGVGICFDPLNVTFFHSKVLLDRSFTSSMKKSAQRDANTARALAIDYEIRSRDPGHAHLGVVLWSLRREAPSCMSVPNLKRIALFVQKLLGGPKFRPTAQCRLIQWARRAGPRAPKPQGAPKQPMH